MTFEMTRDEAAALAGFIERLRRRLPGDTWHKPGIEDALGQARSRASAPDLACAAIRAAEIPTNRTPAVIGMDGPHWREAVARPRPQQVVPGDRCTACSLNRHDHERRWAGDHEFTPPHPVADPPDVWAATRQEVKADRGRPVRKRPPKTLDEMTSGPRVQALKAEMAAARVAAAAAIAEEEPA